MPQADLPYIKIPLHTVIKLTPKAYGCDEERFVKYFGFMLSLLITRCSNFSYTLPITAVDTHRPKPKVAVQPTATSSTSREYFAWDQLDASLEKEKAKQSS